MNKMPLWMVVCAFLCSCVSSSAEKTEKRIVCYYTNWSVYRQGIGKFVAQNINPFLCTHLIYAFAGMNGDFELDYFDKYQDVDLGGYAKFVALRSYNPKLKLLIAVGGWNEGSQRWSLLVQDESSRETFIRSAVKFLKTNRFDGLDLDWEYPAFREGSQPEDKENYAKLVAELRLAFDNERVQSKGRRNWLLTMAVPAGEEYIRKGYELESLTKNLDFMNILSYDYHTAQEPQLNHHSALYSDVEEDDFFIDELSVNRTVDFYLSSGVDPGKLVVGIPTYGRSYTLAVPQATDFGSPADGPGKPGDYTKEAGFLSYYEICYNNHFGGWTESDPETYKYVAFSYKDDQWVTYDSKGVVQRKGQYAASRKLGGIMFWSLDSDDFRGWCGGEKYPLIEAGKESFLTSSFVEALLDQQPQKNQRYYQEKRAELDEFFNGNFVTPPQPTTPKQNQDFTCQREGSFNDPHDCTKYFRCVKSNQALLPTSLQCPSAGLEVLQRLLEKQKKHTQEERNAAVTRSPPVTQLPFATYVLSTYPGSNFRKYVSIERKRVLKKTTASSESSPAGETTSEGTPTTEKISSRIVQYVNIRRRRPGVQNDETPDTTLSIPTGSPGDSEVTPENAKESPPVVSATEQAEEVHRPTSVAYRLRRIRNGTRKYRTRIQKHRRLRTKIPHPKSTYRETTTIPATQDEITADSSLPSVTAKNRNGVKVLSPEDSRDESFISVNVQQFTRVPRPSHVFSPDHRKIPYNDIRILAENTVRNTESDFRCSSQGLFPHPSSCKHFIFCANVNGKSFQGWTFTCPANLVFDPIGNMCNWTEKNNCSNQYQ